MNNVSDDTDRFQGKSGSRPLGGWVAEGTVIVLSILLAFAIDAAYESRQEMARHRAVLEGLEQEFGVARAEFDSMRVRWTDQEGAALRMLEIIRQGGAPPGSYDIPDSIALRMTGRIVLDPPQGAVQAVLSSGDIALIRNPELRRMIADWPRVMQGVAFEQADDSRILIDHMVPILNGYVPFTSIDFRRGVEGISGPSSFAPRYDELLGSLEFENWVDWRALRAAGWRHWMEVLSARSDSILRLIEKERGS